MKVAFLDRDGTIIKDYPDLKWKEIKEPEFFKNSITTLQNIKNAGYEIIFLSNQYIINDNVITIEQFQEFNNKFLETLKLNNIEILEFCYCPHNDNDNCKCKKPRTGMIDYVLNKYPAIDLNQSFYVGDSKVDFELAEKFNLKFFYINGQEKLNNKNTIFINDLSMITKHL